MPVSTNGNQKSSQSPVSMVHISLTMQALRAEDGLRAMRQFLESDGYQNGFGSTEKHYSFSAAAQGNGHCMYKIVALCVSPVDIGLEGRLKERLEPYLLDDSRLARMAYLR